MKLKVSTSPYTYFLLLMTIMDTGYFVLLNIPGLRDTGYMRIGFLLIATLLAMNCYINKNIYRTLQPYYNYLNVFILYLVVFYFAQVGAGIRPFVRLAKGKQHFQTAHPAYGGQSVAAPVPVAVEEV